MALISVLSASGMGVPSSFSKGVATWLTMPWKVASEESYQAASEFATKSWPTEK